MIENGKLMPENLQREWVRPETVQFELRLIKRGAPRDIQEARLQPKGQVSVLHTRASKPVQKKHLRLFR